MKQFLLISLLFLCLTVGAFAQGTAPIRIKEVDGSPNKLGVITLVVPNGTLSVSGLTATLTYGTGSGSVTSVSVTTANGVSGSVATATTTPAITLTLGDITPTSVTTGNVIIDGGATAAELRFVEPSGGGTSYTGFKSPALAANVIYTLPIADGSANQVLTTNGSKALSWTTPSAGITGPGTSTNHGIPRWNGTGGTAVVDSGIVIDDSNNITGLGSVSNGAMTITSSSATAFVVGQNGATNPALRVDASRSFSVSGIEINSGQSGEDPAIIAHSVIGNVGISFQARGSGTFMFRAFEAAQFLYIDNNGNVTINPNSFVPGTSAQYTLAMKNGTMPTSSPADGIQLTANDAVAGKSSLYLRDEEGNVNRLNGLARRVSSQFDKTSDVTLANITGLSRDVEANRAYAFRAVLYTTSNVAGGVQAAVGGTATASSISYEATTTDAGAATVITKTRATALGTAVGAVTAVTAATIEITGTIVVTNAGTLTIQFAQNASNGTASSVLVNSFFHLIPIS